MTALFTGFGHVSITRHTLGPSQRVSTRTEVATVTSTMRRYLPSIVALVIVAIFSVYQRDILSDIFSRLVDVHPLGFLPLAFAGASMVVARAMFLQACSPGISLKNAIVADQSALAAGYGIAFGGGAVGTALRIQMFTRWGLTSQPIAASIVTTAVVPSFTTWGLPIITLLPLIVSGTADNIERVVFLAAIALIVISIVFWWCALRSEILFRWTGQIAVALQKIALRRLPSRFKKTRLAIARAEPHFFSNELRLSVVSLLRNRGLRILASSILTLVAAFFCLLTSATLFGGDGASVSELLVTFSLIRVLIAISPIPGAAGVAELGLIALLEQCGLSTVDATGTTLLYRFLTWFIPIVVGTVLWWRHTHSSRKTTHGSIHHNSPQHKDTRGSIPLHG